MARSSRRSTVIGAVVSVVVLAAVFLFLFPRFADYGAAFDQMLALSPWWIAALVLASLVNIGLYPLDGDRRDPAAALPGRVHVPAGGVHDLEHPPRGRRRGRGDPVLDPGGLPRAARHGGGSRLRRRRLDLPDHPGGTIHRRGPAPHRGRLDRRLPPRRRHRPRARHRLGRGHHRDPAIRGGRPPSRGMGAAGGRPRVPGGQEDGTGRHLGSDGLPHRTPPRWSVRAGAP